MIARRCAVWFRQDPRHGSGAPREVSMRCRRRDSTSDVRGNTRAGGSRPTTLINAESSLPKSGTVIRPIRPFLRNRSSRRESDNQTAYLFEQTGQPCASSPGRSHPRAVRLGPSPHHLGWGTVEIDHAYRAEKGGRLRSSPPPGRSWITEDRRTIESFDAPTSGGFEKGLVRTRRALQRSQKG